MDYAVLVRNAKAVKAACKEGNDGSIVTTRKATIVIPERFLDKQLATIGRHLYVVGVFAHVVDDKYYANFLAPTMVELGQANVSTVKFDETSYLEFSYDPGQLLLKTQECVMDKLIVYRIYDEVYSKGHVPWYLNYDDKIKLLFASDRVAGSNIMSNHAMLELNAAATTRDPKDIATFFRQVVKSYEEVEHAHPIHIPLMSVTHGTTNAVSRLMGSYWDQGITAELVNPSTKVENIERLLRS